MATLAAVLPGLGSKNGIAPNAGALEVTVEMGHTTLVEFLAALPWAAAAEDVETVKSMLVHAGTRHGCKRYG
jgi:hypothetical protein